MKFFAYLIAVAAAQVVEDTEVNSGGFSTSQAQIALELSSFAYCDRGSYMSHRYKGVLSGFVPTYVIWSGWGDST